MDSKAAIDLLISRFPSILTRVENRAELYEMGPHYSYGCFATEIAEKVADETYVRNAADFINEMCESGDALLDDVVHLSVLEALPSDPHVAHVVRTHLGPCALDKLDVIEREYYGRPRNKQGDD